MAREKILLVDDEKDFVDIITAVLEKGGYEVVAAYDSAGARKQAARERPSLVILDVMMESPTAGFEVARWLRSEEQLKTIPVIMLTAVNQKFPFNFDKDDIWLPVDVFLEKPVKPEQLLAEVKKAVGQADASRPVTPKP